MLYDFFAAEQDLAPTYILNSVDDSSMKTMGGGMQMDAQTSRWGKISLGVDGRLSTLDDNTRYVTVARTVKATGRQLSWSPFFSNEIKMIDEKLVASWGGRFDFFRISDGSLRDTNTSPSATRYPIQNLWTFSPSAGFVWHLNERASLRTAGGRAFRFPTFSPLYKQATIPGGVRIDPNPDLKPEKLWSCEAGADWKPMAALQSKLTLYYTWGTDFQSIRVVTPLTRQYSNVTSVQTHGAEAELRWKLASAWSSALAYTYERARVMDDVAPENIGHDYRVTPRNKIAWGVDYENPKLFSATSRLRYKDRMFADIETRVLQRAYWTMDAGVSRKIGRVEARLGVENLFNNAYDIFDLTMSTPMMAPGRIVTGSLRLFF